MRKIDAATEANDETFVYFADYYWSFDNLKNTLSGPFRVSAKWQNIPDQFQAAYTKGSQLNFINGDKIHTVTK